MIRQPEREQINRLTVKTLDKVFIARAREGLGHALIDNSQPRCAAPTQAPTPVAGSQRSRTRHLLRVRQLYH